MLAFGTLSVARRPEADETWALTLAIGFMVTLVLWLVIAGVRQLWRRVRRRPKPFGEMLLSPLTLVLLVLLTFLSAVGQANRESAGPATASGSAEEIELKAHQDQTVAWFNALYQCLPGRKRAYVTEYDRLLSAVEKGSQAQGEIAAQQMVDRMDSYETCIRGLPRANPTLAIHGDALSASASRGARASRSYRRGVQAQSQNEYKSGDRLINGSNQSYRKAMISADRYFQKLGGGSAMGDRLNTDEIQQQLAEQ